MKQFVDRGVSLFPPLGGINFPVPLEHTVDPGVEIEQVEPVTP